MFHLGGRTINSESSAVGGYARWERAALDPGANLRSGDSSYRHTRNNRVVSWSVVSEGSPGTTKEFNQEDPKPKDGGGTR